ncbi:hypothetical protein QFZ28_000685 [Neobacillus niacini]|nr:hypothetical protein [Neobacillus niacini]
MKGLKAELKSIFTNRKVLVPIIAILSLFRFYMPGCFCGRFGIRINI